MTIKETLRKVATHARLQGNFAYDHARACTDALNKQLSMEEQRLISDAVVSNKPAYSNIEDFLRGERPTGALVADLLDDASRKIRE